MVLLESGLEAVQNLDGLFHRRLGHVDLLESARQRTVLLEDAAVFLIGCRADAAQVARGEHRLDEIRRIHDAARGRAGADDGVDLVDEQDRARFLVQLPEHALEAFLEVAAVLGAGEQGAQVERVDGAVLEHVGNVAVDDHLGESLGNRRFADAGLADVERVVLTTTAKDLNRSLHLVAPTDKRIDLAEQCLLVEVHGIGFKGRLAGGFRGLVVVAAGREGVAFLVVVHLRYAMRDVVDDIEPGDVLAVQKIDCLGLALSEYRHQHVGARDLFLAGGLYVKDRALKHPLEAKGGLRLTLVLGRQHRCAVVEIVRQLLLELVDLGSARAQNLARGRVVQQRKQQMFDCHELVALLARVAKSRVQCRFQLFTQHAWGSL